MAIVLALGVVCAILLVRMSFYNDERAAWALLTICFSYLFGRLLF